MFNNTLRVSIESLEKLDSLRLNTNWQEKDIFNKLMCDFIPSKIIEILPLENKSYSFKWLDEKYFYELLDNVDYKTIVTKLAEHEIFIFWQ